MRVGPAEGPSLKMASENYEALLTAEEAADRLGTGVRFTRRLIADRRRD
jgi:hypothetical protein